MIDGYFYAWGGIRRGNSRDWDTLAKEILGGKYEFVLTTRIDNENEKKDLDTG
ncbi:hypothetical protein [Agathobaculum sp. Marseille-P7918]|uniref:hypothetical protein n=1 Tax=Agathobaculum sp. Marseille-P7918 TaxID=2479843 RepID=UPI0035697441